MAFAAAAWPAAAQETPSAGQGLDEIVVTARKVAENLQDVPVAVTAFSGDALQQQNATRVSDIARLTPSLSMKESNSNPSGIAITLRGQVQTAILATLDPSVGTYVDGLYWARAYGLNSDLLDVANVQVLKGPQGTLFGRNTTGGAILFETNDPSFAGYSGLVSATYGRFDEMNGTVVLNAPLVADRLAIRLAGQRTKRDGTIRDIVSGERYDDRDSWTGRGKLLFQATDNLSFLLSAELYKTDVQAPKRNLIYVTPNGSAAAAAGGAAIANDYIGVVDADRDLVALNGVPMTDVKTQTYSGTATLDAFFGAIKFIGGYRRIRSIAAYDLDGSPFLISFTDGRQRLSQYSGELQITGKAFGDAVDFATGAFYFHESGTDGSLSQTTPLANPRDTITDGEIDNDSQGVYAQATWHATDRLSFTGGLRYSVDDKGLTIRNRATNRLTGVTSCSLATTVLPDCEIGRKDDFEGISYTAAIDYKIADDILVYAKTSRGFRSGGQNLRAPTAAAFVPFQPEVSREHEVGLKSEFFDRRIRFNVAGYYNRVNDIQRNTVVATASGTATIIGNAGKVRIWGLEAELTAVPVEGLQLSAAGSITRPKYLEYMDLTGDRRRERFENVSRESFSLSAAYTHGFDFGTLLLRTDYSWSGKAALVAFNNPADSNNAAIIAATTQPATGLLNARASLSLDDAGLEVALFARNLTDTRKQSNAVLLPSPIGLVSGQYREPRTYGVTATFRFGER